MSYILKKNKKFLFFAFCAIVYFIIQWVRMKEIYIKINNYKEDYVYIANDAFFKIPTKDNTDTIEFNSKTYKMNKEHLIQFDDNYLITQKVKNLKFEGPVEIFFYNDETSAFETPKHFILHNKENKDYFMEFENNKGIYDKGIYNTNDKFQINHKDFYLSGDNLFVENDFNDVLITKNSKLIDKKEKPEENMTITSEILNYFKLIDEIIFQKNVYLIKKNLEIKSEFLHAFIQNDKKTGQDEIDRAIFKKNVIFINKKKSEIRSHASYFFKKENVFIFCDNVELEDESGVSKSDFSIYYMDTKTIVNLQEGNRFFLERIKKLDKNATKPCIQYKEKISKFVLKREK